MSPEIKVKVDSGDLETLIERLDTINIRTEEQCNKLVGLITKIESLLEKLNDLSDTTVSRLL